MATGTVASRITGVMRDIAAAAALGFFLVADAYSLGNSLPTIVYILVIGGALNAVFIPQLVRKMKEHADDGKAYADRLITLVGTILLIMSVLAVIFAPLIVDLYTPRDYPQQDFDLAVAFARLCLPQIFFYGIYTLFSQVLNARGHFGAPMFAPIANNIIAIATFLLFIAVAGTSAAADGALATNEIVILGVGTTLGVFVQALVLIPVLMRVGYRWRPRFDWRGHGLGKAGKLASWTIGLVLVNQATYVLITRFATQANVDALAAGNVAAGLTTYQKAHLVFMLPHSVITVSVVTAMLPALSRIAASGRIEQVGRDVGSTMRLVASLVLPISAMLAVTGAGIAVLLFGYGAATPEQAALMGTIVSVFMIGLLPFTLFYVLLRGYYALEDTRTPFWITVGFSLVLLVLMIGLFGWVSPGGAQVAVIALSYSVAYWMGFIAAWIILHRKLGTTDAKATIIALMRMFLATVITLAVMLATQWFLVTNITGGGLTNRVGIVINVVVVIGVGSLTYLLAAKLMGVREVTAALSLGKSKLLRKQTS
jgi:putative peptidoglycan lipid II flippase